MTGTVGELLVQLRLLQFNVQAAPPLKDSGNDLIAIRGEEMRAIQVRSTNSCSFNRPDEDCLYHLLAVVQLEGNADELLLDQTKVFLVPRAMVRETPSNCDRLAQYVMKKEWVDQLFSSG